VTSSTYHIEFNIDYQKWKQYFLIVKKPNLLQSWSYGDAKASSQRWNVRRAIIYENDKPIALLQVLYKRFLFIKVVRINQGPLWIVDAPTIKQVEGVFRVIKKSWSIWTFSILLTAPNLENISSFKEILSSLRFYNRGSYKLNSGLINLKQSEEDLRAGLRGNWRRRLKTSEKNELSFVISRDNLELQWLMSKYAEYQKDKSFQGAPIPLLEALHKASNEFHEVCMGFVVHQNERVAATLVAYYGSSCTPLVSWLSDKGRELNAGNFMLWNIVLFSQEKGCDWFDQGGIDEKNPDVARFKRGIPCDEYQLIGEYIVGV